MKRRMVILLSAAFLAAIVLSSVWWHIWRKRSPMRDERKVIAQEVVTAAQCICDCLGGVTNGLNVLKIDARKLDCNRFYKALAGVPNHAQLWMPGEFDWLVIWSVREDAFDFAEIMERYAAMENLADLERSGCASLPAVFASYVGRIRDVLPAFAALAPDEKVVPELFVLKDIPSLDAFDFSGVDADVCKKLKDEMRSHQNVRRIILEGCIASRKGDGEKAVKDWARAAKRHVDDVLLVERLEHLKTNGAVFYKLGRPGMAARCYEVMAQIRPNDPVPVFNYGVCAQRLGKADLAEKAFARARQLDAARKKSKNKGLPTCDRL